MNGAKLRLVSENSFLSFKWVCALSVIIFSLNTWAIMVPRKIDIPRAKPDCSLRSSSIGDYRDLVQKVNIKIGPGDEGLNDPDTREVTTKYPATMPLACEDSKGLAVFGTANYIEGNRVLTVLHNVFEPNSTNCEPRVKLNTCALFDGKKLYPFEWVKDPRELCQLRHGENDDFVLVGNLKSKIRGRKPYEIACPDEIQESKGKKITVVGVSATNYTKGPKPEYGKETLVSYGVSYGKGSLVGKETIKYSNDTGPRTSGGAVLMTLGGKEKLVGVHRGDSLNGQQLMESQSSGSREGLGADQFNNYSEGLTLKSIRDCN